VRCLVHDFAGHPFQIQLSRQLATRGHVVTHLFPAGLPGPKGRLERLSSDPSNLEIRAIPLSQHFKKYSAHRRFLTQRKYTADLKRAIDVIRPDVVLSGNTPIDIQAGLVRYCRRRKIGFVHWVQDVYCEAISYFLRRKLAFGHRVLSTPFRIIEKAVARGSDHNVVIAPAFNDLLQKWGIPSAQVSTIENWAPLEEMPPMPKQNNWSRSVGLGNEPVFLYSGTLGLKHRPDLLYLLAKELGTQCKVVVVSEGIGRDYLDKQPRLENLITMNYQPYHQLPEVLASADVLVATLEPEAGQFAVPSKVLTYLSARRPVLLAGPKNNLAASVLRRSNAGVVVEAADTAAWIREAKQLLVDRNYRETLADNARSYALATFEISKIAARFEEVFCLATGSKQIIMPPQTAAVGS
jgi:colanic acid biosynthesis glycosyl transferase WcaI